jgi:hypothetical protein
MKKKLTEAQLRKMIKEAVMNELNLMPNLGGEMNEEMRIRHGMTEALREYLTGEGGINQTMLGEIHVELDEHISAMAKIIANHMQGMRAENRKRRR